MKIAKRWLPSFSKVSHAMHLKEANLTCGLKITFSPGDIVVVVGPNNAGKSTFLREIGLGVSSHHDVKTVFSRLSFGGSKEIEIRQRLEKHFNIIQEGPSEFVVLSNDRRLYVPPLTGGPDQMRLGEMSSAFVSNLNAHTRLGLSADVNSIDILISKPSHPYHVFMVDNELLIKFSAQIRQSFGLDFTITRVGTPIRAYVGSDFDRSDTMSADRKAVEIGRPMIAQGDGIRSYVGILAEITTMSHSIILLDEPEAFLHPPQARRLAQAIIGNLEGNRQAFIATHSSNFLQGCLKADLSRLRIVRLDRKDHVFTATILEKGRLKEAFDHPAVANTNLLDCLFYEQTVICEGDADANLLSNLASSSDAAPDRFWFSASGKHQSAKLAQLLTHLSIDWRVILDLDALVDWDLLADIARLKSVDLSPFKARIAAALKILPSANDNDIITKLKEELKQSGNASMQIKAIGDILSTRRITTPLKKYGLSAFSNGQQRCDVEEFISRLNDAGICLLPKGELESYVPTIGLHGPKWLSKVMSERSHFQYELSELLCDIKHAIR